MISVSLCMIVKNEEAVLARCLDSVKDLVDEIIIVDTGSTDETKRIAQNYTDNIYDFVWVDSFAEARNFAFSKATKEYTLWLDADDVILKEDQEKIKRLKETLDTSYDSVQMVYVLATDENGIPVSSLSRNRLVKTARQYKWIGAVHEFLDVSGPIFHSDICITHRSAKTTKSDRNLRIYEKQLKDGHEFSPRDLYYFGNECMDHGLFERAVENYRSFLDTKRGWVEDCIRACDQAAEALLQLGRKKEAEAYILESFTYDLPRASLCFKFGYLRLQEKKYEQAIYWYKQAAESDPERVKATGAFINYAYYTWLPHLQLCVCYDAIGKIEQAYYHNEIARLYQPNNASILNNKQYLENVMKEREV
ncbi:tetratricopeptide repeat-containing glycosyltransferase family 2 protein [Bacillus testis]|uniref:tetratricopeptide repeat-containing glycosyltransferase family 2 protein n=1 Tax=Bacillus testis TaxID=1622072 RepID=UPI00067EF616|nr:glycosyltransferase family 2 protein [Bacillus testis]